MEAKQMIRSSKVVFLASALAACGAAALSGCSSAGSASGATNSESTAGEIGLDLTVAGATLNSASFTITGPASFTKTGPIDLTNSTTPSTIIGGIPAATGYSITVT